MDKPCTLTTSESIEDRSPSSSYIEPDCTFSFYVHLTSIFLFAQEMREREEETLEPTGAGVRRGFEEE